MSNVVPTVLSQIDGRAKRLRGQLEQGMVVAPGCYDCITARLVEATGFGAAYVTGSGISMSALGAPDVGLMSFSEVLDRVKRIADVVAIPVIADIDTGYGGVLNVIRSIREMERAGVAAVQIEDQAWPKKCGHEPGRMLVGVDEMTARIKAAVDARADGDMLIIARTDARSTLGLQEAIDRAAAYGEAGADILFVESPETEEEMRTLNRDLTLPTLANMVEGGRTPILPLEELRALGYGLVIYPNSLTRTVGRMGRKMLETLSGEGQLANFSDCMMDHRELWNLFDYPSWVSLESKYAETAKETETAAT
ncbi:isocitrate lyase/PEP mutase family protein [Acuticoccus kandeliae]|uniref:isocitrate lyase/PEP mutase family protein n=1 Tax=Acuticoccus kandeliae TaxID=2073160 RepID=UPI000D3E3494|nr:oxaloacetate decarboxylase [Acuticoccus kandeliae]